MRIDFQNEEIYIENQRLDIELQILGKESKDNTPKENFSIRINLFGARDNNLSLLDFMILKIMGSGKAAKDRSRDYFYPDYEKIGEVLNYTMHHIRQRVRDLVAMGWLEKDPFNKKFIRKTDMCLEKLNQY